MAVPRTIMTMSRTETANPGRKWRQMDRTSAKLWSCQNSTQPVLATIKKAQKERTRKRQRYERQGQQDQTRPQRKGRSIKQKIFKIQSEDNIELDEENEKIVNQHIRQHQEEFQEKETIEFNRLDWNNALINPVTAEEVKARITSFKKKKNPQVQAKKIHN